MPFIGKLILLLAMFVQTNQEAAEEGGTAARKNRSVLYVRIKFSLFAEETLRMGVTGAWLRKPVPRFIWSLTLPSMAHIIYLFVGGGGGVMPIW